MVAAALAACVGCGRDTIDEDPPFGETPGSSTAMPGTAGGGAAPGGGAPGGGAAPGGGTLDAGAGPVGGGGAASGGAAPGGGSPIGGGTPGAAGGGAQGGAAPGGGQSDASAGVADGGGAAGGGDGSVPASTAGKLPRVTTTDGPGPFNGVMKVKSTPPGGWLIYPKEIGKDGIKHPLFVFGPGGGTTPDTYESMGMHWDRYGSYGFVIYVLPQSTGDGAAMKKGLDWLIEQNNVSSSPLYQKLDVTKICAAGHSMGSVTTFDFMPDPRVTTTIHISGGSFDGMGPSHLSKDTMFLCGPSQSADTAVPQCDGDFKNSKVPTFYTQIQGSSHLTSGRLGWASIIAWMLWHLADQEDQWKKEFLTPGGKFQMGIYKSQTKNWQ